jgi:hypothetical protein
MSVIPRHLLQSGKSSKGKCLDGGYKMEPCALGVADCFHPGFDVKLVLLLKG